MMRTTYTYILRLMGGMLMLLLMLTACSSGDDSQSEKTVLKIYVYTPDHPIVTRADNSEPNVTPIGIESTIYSLQVWVFKHGTGDLVGYITTGSLATSENLGTLNMNVTDPAFINNKPNVDVYVMANVTNDNCGIEFDESSSRDDLDAALIEHDGDNDYFGLSSLTTSVSEGVGLPMSGVLKDQPIFVFGTSPVFGIGEDENHLAHVELVRAVSKMHFVFCSAKGDDGNKVKRITINGTTFPRQEYLFLEGFYAPTGDNTSNNGYRYHVGSNYESDNMTIINNNSGISINGMTSDYDPSYYEWTDQTGQAYETLISNGIDANDLNDLGTYYLRESDRTITGTISYRLSGDAENADDRTADFSLHDAGDFSRNHTWIIFAYFNYAKGLNVVTVKVNDWTSTDPSTHEVYNW